MDNISYIFQEYAHTIITGLIGIFGTLIGSIIGSIVTIYVTRVFRQGKISMYICKWQIIFECQNTLGEFEAINESDMKMAERAKYNLEIVFYNSSDDPKSIRNVNILFKQKNKSILSIPYCKKPFKVGNNIYEDFSVINLPSKQFLHLHFEGIISKENIIFFSQNVITFILAYLPNGKEFKSKIADNLN